MEKEKAEKETPENQEEQEVIEEATEEEVVEETPTETAEPEENKEFKSALAQKEHFREKAEKLEAELQALIDKSDEPQAGAEAEIKQGLDVEDYIDISASLDGLDQREKEKLAQEHRLTGKPLKDIRESEDYQLWQSAYQAKVEKERALDPSVNQGDVERPKSLTAKLAEAKSLDEKEKIMVDAGLYKETRKRSDKTNIGQ